MRARELKLTNNTLYVFVNCCVENTRFDVAKQVITILNDEQNRIERDITKDLVVIDNGSTMDGTQELLAQGFPGVCIVPFDKNVGYWAALNWIFSNGPSIRSDWSRFKYVHVIESDHTYYALDRLVECERALDQFSSLGSVRLQEYDVKDKDLYDKTLGRQDGKIHAWVSHVSHVTGKAITCQRLTGDIYESNFLTCLHSLNRLDTMIEVFEKLRHMKNFTENDFQRLYHEKYQRIGVLDGGIFHAKLGGTIYDNDVLSGSWSKNLKDVGYFETRRGYI